MDMNDATLVVRVQADGVDKVTKDLASVGASGEAAATRVVGGMSKISQAMVDSTASAHQFTLTQEQANAIMAQSNGIISDYQAEVRRLRDAWLANNAVAAAAAAAEARLAAETSNLTDATRQMTLTQMKAIEMNQAMETANNTATASFNLAGAGLGRVRQGMASLVAQSTGTIPVIDRMGVSLLSAFGLGNPVIIGVLAGIAAIAFAWKVMETDAHKLATAVDEAMKKVRDSVHDAQLAMGDLQLAAAQKAADEAQRAYDAARKANSGAGGFISGGAAANDAKRDLDAKLAVLLHYQQEKTQVDTQMRFEAQRTDADQLAALIKAGQATAAERARAIAEEKAYTSEAAELAKTQTDNVRRVADIQAAATLHDALNPKEKAFKLDQQQTVVTNALTEALVKQLEELRKANVENNKALSVSAQATELAKREGLERDILAENYKAENEVAAAAITMSGLALEETKKRIDQVRDETIARLKVADAIKQQTDAMAANVKIGKDNKAIADKEQADAAKKIQEQQKYVDDVEKIWRSGIEKITTHGFKNFHNFFEDVLHLFSELMDKMTARAKELGKLGASGFQFDALKYGSAAIAGGLTGYQVGHESGNTTTGVFGGAAAGAATGAAFGPWGAAIGGLAGAAGGLLGAAKAQHEAAEAQKKAAEQAQLSLLQFNVTAGTGTTLQLNQEQLKAQAQALYDAIDAALPGLKNQIEREKEMAQVRKDETLIAAQLLAADKAAREAFVADLGVRNLMAAGMIQAADAARQAIANEKELADVRKQFGEQSAEYQSLVATQAAEAAKRAADAAGVLKRSFEDLAVRALAASGANDRAVQDMQFQLAQERELADLRKSGASDDIIARTQEILALEQKRRDDDFAALNQSARADYQVRGLRASGNTGAADDLAFALAQQRELETAIKQGLDAGTIAALKATQAAEATQYELGKQTKILQDQLTAAQSQLQTAQQSLTAVKQLHDSLATFGLSLRTGALSPLSPGEQLEAARSQLTSIFTAARGGDQAAAGKFEGAANTFLQSSRGYNASGAGYTQDFSAVQSMTDALSGQFGAQESVQQQMVDALQKQIDLLTKELDATTGGTAAMIASLEAIRDNAGTSVGALLPGLDALKAQFDATGQAIIAAQISGLTENRDAVAAAANAQIAAVRAGADVATLHSLSQITALEQQRLQANEDAVKQETALAANGQLSAAQLQAMEAERWRQNDRINRLIDQQRYNLAVLHGDSGGMLAAIESMRDRALEPADALLAALDKIRQSTDDGASAVLRSVGASGRSIVDAQIDSIQKNRDAVAAAANDQIAAVSAGASASEIAQYGQIAELERSRLAANIDAVQQEAMLAANGQLSAAQLQAMEAERWRQNDRINSLIDQQRYNLAVLHGDSGGMLAAIESMRDRALEPADSLLSALAAIRAATEGVGRTVVDAQIDSIQENRNAVAAAANDQIAAIREGKSAAEIASLAQIAQLEQARLASNVNAVQQIQALATQTGVQESQVASVEAFRQQADQAAVAQINAVNSGASATTINQLGQIAAIERQRTEYNAKLEAQIAVASNTYGINSTQAEILRQTRDTANAGFGNQVAATYKAVEAAGTTTAAVGGTTSAASGTTAAIYGQQSLLAAINAGTGWLSYIHGDLASSTAEIPRDLFYLRQILDAQNAKQGIPQFAMGGDFPGGLRIVGERGPELEATGASRITSTANLLSALSGSKNDNAEVVAALRDVIARQDATIAALQTGMARLLAGQKENTAKVEENTTQTKRGLEGIRVAAR